MDEPSDRKNMLRYMSAGMEFIVTFGVPLAGGLWLDKRLGTMPGFTLLGAAVGFSAGLYRLVKTGRQAQREARPPQDDGDARP